MPEPSLSTLLADIEAQLRDEIAALDSQLEKSRGITGHASAPVDLPMSDEDKEAEHIINQLMSLINSAADAYNTAEAASIESADHQRAAALAQIEALRVEEAKLPAQKAATQPIQPAPTQQPAQQAPQASPSASPAAQNTKGGLLLNYGKDRFMRNFASNYLVVSDGVGTNAPAGVSWFDSEAAFKKGAAPIDSIPFFVVEKNSRGSMFKKASVCWPLVTDEDCPKLATADKNKVYFAVDYTNQKSGKTDLVVLGASSEVERNEWVTFITKFVAMYLPPGEEFEPFINFPVGASPPMHVNEVLGGEAPGSAQRVIDPSKR